MDYQKMFRVTLMAVALAVAFPTFAGNDNANACGNNGNNCGSNSNSNNSNAVGVGIGVGKGGSATATGGRSSSYVKVGDLTNQQQQGQIQGQNQSSSSTVKNSGNSVSVSDGGTAVQGQSMKNAGNQSINITEVHPNELKIKSVGIAPDVGGNTTAQCRIAVSASAGWIGGALGIGSSVLDSGCDTGRDIEILRSLGLHNAAILRACAKKELAAAMGDMCPAKTSESASDKPGRS
jgi:hypothetical protein